MVMVISDCFWRIIHAIHTCFVFLAMLLSYLSFSTDPHAWIYMTASTVMYLCSAIFVHACFFFLRRTSANVVQVTIHELLVHILVVAVTCGIAAWLWRGSKRTLGLEF
jgi:hypothetical protein